MMKIARVNTRLKVAASIEVPEKHARFIGLDP
jgi:hypothetical protein